MKSLAILLSASWSEIRMLPYLEMNDMQQLHPNYSLTRSKAEGSAEEDFINPLPRAVLRSNSFILLDGEWNFAI
ncbi:MAG TPA: hypothetical protein VEB42_16640, partial [Chitinophagaceae bacterium]|nr:hypothetical protein [Chitinophagaceae bacterium]